MRQITKNLQSGFTLIELMIVCAIILVLSSIVLMAANPMAQFEKANDGRRKSDLSQIQKSLETYYQDNKSYPLSDTSYQIKNASNISVPWGQSWSPYMNTLPKDPSSSKNYAYFSTGQSYWLYASLDRADKDNQACHIGTVDACDSISTNGISADACGTGKVCNYGLSSPNVSP